MYTDYWQLDFHPFGTAADRRFYYPSDSHQGALLKLRYIVESGGAAALLAGRSGTGKTMLVHMLLSQLPEIATPRAHIVFPQMSGRDLLVYLAEKLNVAAISNPRYSVEESVRRLETSLRENARHGRQAVLIIDEADLLEDTDALDTLRLVLNFEHDGKACCTLILVGQPALLSAVGRRPDLEERIGVKTLIPAFSPDETAAYIEHRLQAAGATRSIFDDSALESAHYLAHGLPRSINRLCDLSLLIGFAEGRTSISADQIESVSNELVAVSPE